MNYNEKMDDGYFEFDHYDKISDNVYTFGSNSILRFNVSLTRVSTIGDKKRESFHKEFKYYSKPDLDNAPETILTVRRTYDYYFSIESIKKDNYIPKAFIRIGPAEFYTLKKGLDQALGWFQSKRYEHLFRINTDTGLWEIVPPVPEKLHIGPFCSGKYIDIEASLISTRMDARNETGVMITLDKDNISYVTLDQLGGLIYILDGFNMFQSAQVMLNYIGKPPMGLHEYDMTGRMEKPKRNYIRGEPTTFEEE